MRQTALWIPPSLCGCKLWITAEFTPYSVVNGVSYRHPKPFTITDIKIETMCEGHALRSLSMPDTSGLFDEDPINGGLKQNRGYLSYPIADPTPAECLYTFLAQYGGQTHSYSCGCRAHQFVDEEKNVVYLQHPLHTRKCRTHHNDTHDMQQAAIDHKVALGTITKGDHLTPER